MFKNNSLSVYKISENASIPTPATSLSDCFDIRACFDGRKIKIQNGNSLHIRSVLAEENDIVTLYENEYMLCPSGLIFLINPNNAMHIYNRSSLVWKHNITIPNAPGIIDADYTDELFIMLKNNSYAPFYVEHNMRIAQAKLVESNTSSIQIISVDKNDYNLFKDNIKAISKNNVRDGGIGSTGLI